MTLWSNLSARERRLAILTAAALFIVAPLAIAPYLEADPDEKNDPDAGLAQVQDVLGQVDKQLQANQALRNRLGNPEARFVSEKKLSTFLIALEEAGGKAGLGLKSYSPAVREKAKPLPEVTVQVDYAGNYKSLVKFLDELERLKIPAYVRNLRISIKDEKSGELTGSVKVSSYLVDEPKYIGKKQDGDSKEGAGPAQPGESTKDAGDTPPSQPAASGAPGAESPSNLPATPGQSSPQKQPPGLGESGPPESIAKLDAARGLAGEFFEKKTDVSADALKPARQLEMKVSQQTYVKTGTSVAPEAAEKGGPSK